MCSELGLKAGCQAVGAPRIGGAEDQFLFVIDAYAHRWAEESLELDDLMAHRFIQLSGIQRGNPLLEKGFVGHPAIEYVRCSHRLGNVHPEIDQVDRHLDIRGDDGLAAGTSDDPIGLAFFCDNRGRHAGQGPLSRRGQVGPAEASGLHRIVEIRQRIAQDHYIAGGD
jgi:hypothetical protein